MYRLLLRGLVTCSVSFASFCLLMFPFQTSLAQDQAAVAAGEQVFQTYCVACHGIGEAQRVGPDLAGLHDRRTQDWMQRFVKSPKAMIDSGDADATALLASFNGMVMPDSVISDQQIIEVLLYIESQSSSVAGSDSTATDSIVSATLAEPSAVEPPSAEAISEGGDLFQGKIRFSNSGPACNACHDVKNNSVAGGGTLAADLTTVYSRMGAAGLTAILAQTPFPAMQSAYSGEQFEEAEIAALVAFFQSTDATGDAQQATDFGLRLFLSGMFGATFLFGLFPFLWRSRKIDSVNQSIYDRQSKTG